MTRTENQGVQDNIPPAADTAPSAAKHTAAAAKGLDGQSVLKRYCNFLTLSWLLLSRLFLFLEGSLLLGSSASSILVIIVKI